MINIKEELKIDVEEHLGNPTLDLRHTNEKHLVNAPFVGADDEES